MLQEMYDYKLQNQEVNNNPVAIFNIDPTKEQVLFIKVKALKGISQCMVNDFKACLSTDEKFADY